MEGTDWDAYGVGNYAKCSDCMVHCGFEATAVAIRSTNRGSRCWSPCAA